MSGLELSSRCYSKLCFHAAKYPSSAVCGLLLAESSKPHTAVDAIPLFHQCLHLAPHAEFALTHIDTVAQKAGLSIIGYYAASDNYNENAFDKVPGIKIAEKIAEFYPSAYLIVIDNKQLSLILANVSLKIAQHQDGKWKPKDPSAAKVSFATLDCVSRFLSANAFKKLVDYDNHLDDISLDWTNAEINTQIDQVMKMYDGDNLRGSYSISAYSKGNSILQNNLL